MNRPTDNPDQSLVGTFCLTISLWIVRRGEDLFDPIFIEQLLNILIGKRSSVICDDMLRNSESAYYVLFDEGGNRNSSGASKRNSFDPLGEVLCRSDDVFMLF